MPIYKAPLNKEVLQARLSYIEDSIKSLERFKGISFDEFHSSIDNFRIAFYDLHRALEAAMDIGSHILSRIPGARATSYKDIPKLLGKHKIIPADFADNQLNKMAGYRNRMVHFYAEITESELYNIIQEDLQDFYILCKHISELLKEPTRVGLTIE
ncbi:MAG: DUF86 domain-containing protein [Nitrospirae bacterium]|nr:DUF86 domain-containing protein [Nitrospirota bacterium]